MAWGQGVSTGMWQEEELCSATVLACSRSRFLLLGLPQPRQQSFPKYPCQGGPHRDTETGGSFSGPCSRYIDPIQQTPWEQRGWPLQLTRFSPSTSQPDEYLPREYWEKLVAEAGFGPSLNLKDCSWPYMLLMRLGMHMLELLVQAVKVPRNVLNPRLEPKLIPVLYHIYSFRSSWQVSLVRGALGLCRSPLHWNQAFARPFSFPAAFPAQGHFEEPLVLCGQCPCLA